MKYSRASTRWTLPWRSGDLRLVTIFFFFQAEDGIRDIGVTGVQTCALPILIELDTGGKGTPDRTWGEPVVTLSAKIDQLGKGGQGPHTVGRRRLQRDFSGGIDDERRQPGVCIVRRRLGLPRGESRAGRGQSDRARLPRAVGGLRKSEPDKGSAELERGHVAQCRGARLIFVNARLRLTSQPRCCRRERRT